MAKKNTTTAPAAATTDNTNATPTTTADTSKADSVRAYKAAHPDASPKEIAEALAKQNIEVSAGRVSGILRQGKASTTVNADQIKAAFSLVRSAGTSEQAIAQLTAAGEAMALLKSCKDDVELAKAAVAKAEELRALMS